MLYIIATIYAWFVGKESLLIRRGMVMSGSISDCEIEHVYYKY